MLTRRTRLQQGTAEQASHWLAYLATQLQRQQQTIFAVEYLQPTWLPDHLQRWYRWSMPLVYALIFGLIFGPLFGGSFGIVYWLLHRILSNLIFGLLFGLMVGVIGGLIGGLIFGITFKQHHMIQPSEAATWSWTASRKGLMLGLGGGIVVGAAGGLTGSIVVGPLSGVALGVSAAVLIGLVGGLVGGFSPQQLPERIALIPNEGIWRSGRRGLFLVVICILLFGIAGGLLVGLLGTSIGSFIYGPIFGISLGAVGGLIFGLFFGLVGGRTGIAAFLQHFALRLFLWRFNLLPWNLVAFLEEGTERLLLRKVGGNYIFVHRLLRDVLAAQENDV